MSPAPAAASAAIAAQLIRLCKQRLVSARQAPPATAAAPVPPPIDLRCLDGLRAVSALIVCLFHCWLGFASRYVPWEAGSMLGRHHPLIRQVVWNL